MCWNVGNAVGAVIRHDAGLIRSMRLPVLLRAELGEKTGRTGEDTEGVLLLGRGGLGGRLLRATLRAGVEVAEQRGGRGGGGARRGRRRQVGVE